MDTRDRPVSVVYASNSPYFGLFPLAQSMKTLLLGLFMPTISLLLH